MYIYHLSIDFQSDWWGDECSETSILALNNTMKVGIRVITSKVESSELRLAHESHLIALGELRAEVSIK